MASRMRSMRTSSERAWLWQPGRLRATIRVEHEKPVASFSATASHCRGDFAGPRELDGTFDVSLAPLPWVVAVFDGSETPVVAGALDESRRHVLSTALRVCVPQTGDPTCQGGDVELSVDVAPETNVVFVFSLNHQLAGVRDVDGIWSCTVETTNPANSSCGRGPDTVIVPGSNGP